MKEKNPQKRGCVFRLKLKCIYKINEKEKKTNQKIQEKNSEKTSGPCFLPQTQKHVHNIKKIKSANK